MTTLLVGRGLLGGHVERRLRATGEDLRTVRVPWHDHEAALTALLGAAERTARQAGAWRLAWCAGAGVVSTPHEDLLAEAALFRAFVAGLAEVPDAFFLSSSAGGAYSGSSDGPPFTEESAPAALTPYGATKLDMEDAVGCLAERGGRVVTGRIANLYGPGQDLGKPQGLVSQLCLTHLTGEALSVYVSLDTLRDYLYVADAADMVVAALDRVEAEPPGAEVTKILASGRAVSVAAIIAESGRAFRRRPRLATRVDGVQQARDLRLRSVVWPELDGLARTSLLVGLRATADDLGRQLRAGALRRPTP